MQNNIKDVKFTISVYMRKSEVIDCIIPQFTSKIVGYREDDKTPIYKTEATNYINKYKNIGDRILKTYVQLPIICDDFQLSVIIDPKTEKTIQTEGYLLTDYNIKYKNNRLDDEDNYTDYKPEYCEIRYGYEYIKNGTLIKNNNFKTIDDRNKSCLLETGVNFNTVDYSDKLEKDSNKPIQFIKK